MSRIGFKSCVHGVEQGQLSCRAPDPDACPVQAVRGVMAIASSSRAVVNDQTRAKAELPRNTLSRTANVAVPEALQRFDGTIARHATDSVVRGMETTKTRYDYGEVRT